MPVSCVEKQWLQEAAHESTVHQRVLWAESEKESLEEVAKAGVEIIYPPKEPFAATVDPLYRDYEADPELKRRLRRLDALVCLSHKHGLMFLFVDNFELQFARDNPGDLSRRQRILGMIADRNRHPPHRCRVQRGNARGPAGRVSLAG